MYACWIYTSILCILFNVVLYDLYQNDENMIKTFKNSVSEIKMYQNNIILGHITMHHHIYFLVFIASYASNDTNYTEYMSLCAIQCIKKIGKPNF